MKYACKKAGTSVAAATERWKRPHNADKHHMAAARRAPPRENEYGAETSVPARQEHRRRAQHVCERNRPKYSSTNMPTARKTFARRAGRIVRLAEQNDRSVNPSANSLDMNTARWTSRLGMQVDRPARQWPARLPTCFSEMWRACRPALS